METAGNVAVTGANRGIGAGIAIELARRGFTVACLARSGGPPDMEGLPAEVAGRLRPLRGDVTDMASLDAAFAEIAGWPGGLTGLVNNAGILITGASAGYEAADFMTTIETNALGTFRACQAAYPHFVANGGGTVVNIGSFWERVGVPQHTAYCASKAAIAAITRCLAVEWASKNIWFHNIAPGYIETELNKSAMDNPRFRDLLQRRVPVGRAGTVDEVARFVACLLTERIAYLTGETIFMDGGQTVNR